ncbi:MAG: VOC family protein [Deltaproteobacteria bacterium]|nr:VOC family protein [Deltaproteobacteria bacterium]
MGFHHVAFASRDTQATHRFYTEAMGFELVKTNTGKTPAGGWAKHFFYDTGGGSLIAFWEIHDDAQVKPDWSSDISGGCGLPPWVNHLAFEAHTEEQYQAALVRWNDNGQDVAESPRSPSPRPTKRRPPKISRTRSPSSRPSRRCRCIGRAASPTPGAS